ncbi:asparagine synthase-related protein [Crossiella sp. CA-258035]|uniref:asparagine synthase-related protein n=1 Tax=Crossiella sp. CA-258035 TaxID=2981138 RepID=UPI0024BC6296|nr:asparagine synthase-related protein [Crossiella sp. CA-258035]WHT17989.1 asparagine synthase-related protein [Crossiella sp. CA-258035]
MTFVSTVGHTPCVVGSFPALQGGAVATAPASATQVWPGLPIAVTWGEWRPREFRTVACPEVQLLLIGQCAAGDAQLRADLATALRRDRLELVTWWPGSYLAIVATEEKLVAFVDLAGQYPLYYHPGERLTFGTSPVPTAMASGAGLKTDPLVAAAEIFCGAVPMLTHGLTPVRGLRRLEAGEALQVTARGAVSRWTHADLAPDQRLSLGEAAGALRESLEIAVSTRTAIGHVSTDFSGGFDSTSIAFLAARHLSAPLTAFVYHHPDAPADDLDHAVRNAGLSSKIQLEIVPGTSATLPYRNLGASPPTGLPDFAAVTHERNHLRLRHVAATGEGVHLGGEGADALVVAPPAYLGDLASERRIRQLLADSGAWARLRNESPAHVLSRAIQLSRTSRRRALHAYARRLHRLDTHYPSWVDAISWWPSPGPESSWLTIGARRALVELMHDHADRVRQTPQDGGVADFTARNDLRRSGAVQQQLSEMARPYCVWPQAPFLDNDVVRACTALLASRRASGTVFKPLVRTALNEVIPAAALDRRSKGNYLGEDYRGARIEAAGLRKRVSASPLADMGLIEPSAVRSSIDRAVLGADTPFPALNRLIAYDLWLRSME